MGNEKPYESLPITRFKKGEGFTSEYDKVIKESSIRIFFNGDEIVSILALKKELDDLAVGFLFNSCIINDVGLIEKIDINDRLDAVMVESKEQLTAGTLSTVRSVTTGCGKGVAFINPLKEEHFIGQDDSFTVKATDVTRLMKEFGQTSKLFEKTGCVHSAAWSDGVSLIHVAEDIGRHNCVDKLIGWKLMQGDDSVRADMILSSGRLSSEIIVKGLRARIPIIISHSAPTTGAVQLATEFHMTIVGFTRGERFNIYSHPERIIE